MHAAPGRGPIEAQLKLFRTQIHGIRLVC
jgi:hypothetical protein